jgi:CRISPR-associated protein Csd2
MNEKNRNTILRATGLLVIEVVNSNPNGDPDRESDPRTRPDRRGEISPVSFKRKVRDLLEGKDGPAWQEIQKRFTPPLDCGEFEILESRGRDREKVIKEADDGTFFGKVLGCARFRKHVS